MHVRCSHESETEMNYISKQKYRKPHMITQIELNALYIECFGHLIKNKVEFLGLIL